MSENLRQILDDHELYKSVQKMSSYAAQTSPRPISPRSYVGSNTGTTLVAEHRLPRAHLNKSSSDLQIGNSFQFCPNCTDSIMQNEG